MGEGMNERRSAGAGGGGRRRGLLPAVGVLAFLVLVFSGASRYLSAVGGKGQPPPAAPPAAAPPPGGSDLAEGPPALGFPPPGPHGAGGVGGGVAAGGVGFPGRSLRGYHRVLYRVTGTAAPVDIVYGTGDGGASHTHAGRLPDTMTTLIKPGEPFSVSGRAPGPSGHFAVEVWVDGRLRQRSVAQGAAVTAAGRL